MPNHVKNKIIFSGDQQKINGLLERIQNDERGFGTIDFNKIIPMPESLHIDAGSTETEAINNYLTAVNPVTPDYKMPKMEVPEFILLLKRMNQHKGFGGYNPNLSDSLIKANMVVLGEKYVTNFQNHGATTWYDWSIENWGSKWESYRDEPFQDNTISYCTAWSRVMPVITKLAEMAPELDIEYQWADEDLGNNVGFAEFSGGELINDCFHDPWSNKAYELCAEIWDIDLVEEGLLFDKKSGSYVYHEEQVEEMEKGIEMQ